MSLTSPQRRGRTSLTVVARAFAVTVAAMLVAAFLAPSAAWAKPAGRPAVEITAPTAQDRVVIFAGRAVEVSFTSNRDWQYTLDVRGAGGDGEWVALGSGRGAADTGENDVEATVPRTLERGDYDLRLRLFSLSANPDRHRPVAEHVAESALEVETPGYVSKITTGPLAGTSFQYLESPNTPQVADHGPLAGRVTYVGLACDDGPAVPQAPDGGGFALVERGDCTFAEKLSNVSGAGWSVFLLFNEANGSDGCDALPSSMTTAGSIPMLAIWRSTGLQLLGEAGADGIDCSNPPAVQAEIGQAGEGVLFHAQFDPDSTQTGFEQRGGIGWTEHDEELTFLETVDEASERMTYTEIGESVEGRPLHLVRVGNPAPPPDDEITDERSVLVIGSQHGNEPAGREMALQLLRDLAFTDDEELVDQLDDTTVLVIPSANPDGREANTRTNASGVDLNRDHLSITQPEVRAITEVVRDYRPDITIDAHERPAGSSPDLEVAWPRNLNVDEPLRDLNVDMVENYVRPDVEEGGFTTGLYGSPGGAGGEDERISRNMFGLRHGVGMLTESAGRDAPAYRVDAQLAAANSVLRFFRERDADVTKTVAEAPGRKAEQGANQSAPFYLGGADWRPPEEHEILDPAPCGYVINTTQASDIERLVELFPLETEQVSENGVFVTMGQPMMTVVPLLLDQRALFNEVAGVAVTDPATCADPSTVEPPQDTEPAQYSTDFSADEAGASPQGWSTLWRDSGWTILDGPRRLQHTSPTQGRRALTWDEVGTVHGDVEVFGLVRAPTGGPGGTMFQFGFDFSGDAGSENTYYVDARLPDASAGPANHVTINRYRAGSYSMLASAELPFTADPNTWYRVVLQREGSTLRAKMWPDGADEPADWQVTTTDTSSASGQVGMAHVGPNVVNDYAFVGVGTGGEPAPHAPDDLVLEPSPPAQYSTDFADGAAGEQPPGWTGRWNPAVFTVQDDPRRVRYQPSTGSRSVASFDEVGLVAGDVEVAGVVRVPAPMPTTRFQIHLNVSGDASATESYYADVRPDAIRIRRYHPTGSTNLASAPFAGINADTWYNVVFRREGDALRAKVWPFGQDEPAGWMVETTNTLHDSGRVGFGHFGTSTVNEWAWYSTGTGGEPAPRPPADLVEPPVAPDQVTGLGAEQDYGFATLTWDPVDGATEYQIERTPLDGGQPAGPGEVVGRWLPARYPGGELSFADTGFEFGQQYQWRVRAVAAGLAGAWSDPVAGDIQQQIGPLDQRTEFELGGGAEWTSHEGELGVLEQIAAASDRVRLETIGQTAQGRPLQLVTVGDPAPGTPEEIAESPSMLFVCTIHGTEPAAREACLILLRRLAFSSDPWVTSILEQATVLMIPTANPDGRAVNERENSAGQDLNRDNLLLRHPETVAIAEVIRDYRPDMVVDGHEYQAADASDISSIWARSPNVGEQLWRLTQDDTVLGRLFGAATNAGWWPLQYPLTATGWEGQLQNAAGLKNRAAVLVETRRRPGPTRPGEGDPNTLVTTPQNQQRRVYTHLWAFEELLDHHHQSLPAINEAIAAAEAAAIANEGPVYLDGMRDVASTPPPNQPPTKVLDPAPCGYQLTDEQYNEQSGAVASVADRLAIHGVEVETVDGSVLVPMGQPLRGLIPYLLDPQSDVGMVQATRLDQCGG